jgi:hypothetical protein
VGDCGGIMTGKIIKFDYDFIASKDDSDAIPVCLTIAERQILLTMLEYVSWSKRWYSPTAQTIPQDKIDEWCARLYRKLFGECDVNCDDVIACLISELGGEGDDITQTLLDWLREHQNDVIPYPSDNIGTIEIAGDNLNIAACDANEIFGFTLQLVQLFDRLITNFFEIIEVATNAAELVQAALDSVPVLSTVTDLLNYAQETLAENYAANYDVELEENIACDLLCLMIANDGCTLTWDEIIEYLSLQVSYELADVSIQDLGTFIVEGVWDGDEFVYIMFLLVAAVIAIGADWTGVTLASIQRTIASYFNDPNSDWETLCTNCVWSYSIDFEAEQGNWELTNDFLAQEQGMYTLGTGWGTTVKNNGVGGDDTSRAVGIAHPMSSTDSVIRTVSIHYNFIQSGNWDGTGNNHRTFLRDEPLYLKLIDATSDPTGNDKGMTFLGDAELSDTTTEFVIKFVSGRVFDDYDPGGQAVIKSVLITGIGDNPFD